MEPYFIYAIIMSVVAVRKIAIPGTTFTQILRMYTYTHIYAVGHRAPGDSGDEEKNRAGYAAFPGGG